MTKFTINGQTKNTWRALRKAALKEECGRIKASELIEKVGMETAVDVLMIYNTFSDKTGTFRAFDYLIEGDEGTDAKNVLLASIQYTVLNSFQSLIPDDQNRLKELYQQQTYTDADLEELRTITTNVLTTANLANVLIEKNSKDKKNMFGQIGTKIPVKRRTEAPDAFSKALADPSKGKQIRVFHNQLGIQGLHRYEDVTDLTASPPELWGTTTFNYYQDIESAEKAATDLANKYTDKSFVVIRPKGYKQASVMEVTNWGASQLVSKLNHFDGAIDITNYYTEYRSALASFLRTFNLESPIQTAKTIFSRGKKYLRSDVDLVKFAKTSFQNADLVLSGAGSLFDGYDAYVRMQKKDKGLVDYAGIAIVTASALVGGAVVLSGTVASAPAFLATAAAASAYTGALSLTLAFSENAGLLSDAYDWITGRHKSQPFTFKTDKLDKQRKDCIKGAKAARDKKTTDKITGSIMSDWVDADQVKIYNNKKYGTYTSENPSIFYGYGPFTSPYSGETLYTAGGDQFRVTDRITGLASGITGTYTMSYGGKTYTSEFTTSEEPTIITSGYFSKPPLGSIYGDETGAAFVDFTIQLSNGNIINNDPKAAITGVFSKVDHGNYYTGTMDVTF